MVVFPTPQIRRQRIDACIYDLSNHGIQIEGATDFQLADVVRHHLDYFQSMLGYDSSPKQVLSMLKRRSQQKVDA
jgi:hypothetical protein